MKKCGDYFYSNKVCYPLPKLSHDTYLLEIRYILYNTCGRFVQIVYLIKKKQLNIKIRENLHPQEIIILSIEQISCNRCNFLSQQFTCAYCIVIGNLVRSSFIAIR